MATFMTKNDKVNPLNPEYHCLRVSSPLDRDKGRVPTHICTMAHTLPDLSYAYDALEV